MPSTNFFTTQADWSRRKHLILSYYLKPAAYKFRSVSPDGRVFILDGFAGRGQYLDAGAGSPMYTGQLAADMRAVNSPVALYVYNVEPNSANYAELNRCTAQWVQSGYVTNLRGTFQQTLSKVLNDAKQSPLFAFLDPFRPKQLSFDDFLPLLRRRALTEVCVVFFTRAVQRNLQAMMPTAKTSEEQRGKLGEHLNDVFGGTYWQQLIQNNSLGYDDIIDCLRQHILSVAHSGRTGSPAYVLSKQIVAREKSHVKYHILLYTRHIDGVMLMNDAFVKEAGDVRATAEEKRRWDDLKRRKGQGLLDIFDDPNEAEEEQKARMNSLLESILDIGRADLSRSWRRSALIEKSIVARFAEFNEAQHRQSIQQLADKTEPPRIVPENATFNAKSKKWKMNEDTVLRFEF